MDAKAKANFINSLNCDNNQPKKACPNCNALNDNDSKFCIECGTSLDKQENSLVCPACGVSNNSDSKFCVACGTQLEQEKKNKPLIVKKEQESKNQTEILKKSEYIKADIAFSQVPQIVEEESNVFAEGLPEWDIIPPQVVVRRRKK